MNTLFILLWITLDYATISVGVFAWAAHRGQFDDLETPPQRMLYDDTDN